MPRYRSLIKTLITKNPNRQITNNDISTRLFVTSAPAITPSLFKFHPLLNPTHNSSRVLSPPSKWIAPSFQVVGPLFLSSPPWKLSQSATPLFYLRKHSVVLRKVEALNLNIKLNLLRTKTLGLGPGSVAHPGFLRLVEGKKEEQLEISRESGAFVDSLVNLPNLISISRLVSGPLLGWMIINEMYSYAFVGLAISGATDWLDGYVARKMRINSVVGSYLDPLADKVLIGCVALAMADNDLLHPGLVVLVVLRDVALVGGAVYQRASSLGWQWKSWFDFFNLDGTRPEKVEPLFISKVNTVFQLVLVAAALLQPEFGTTETQTYIKYLSWLVASTTVASTAAYGKQYMRKRSAMTTSKL